MSQYAVPSLPGTSTHQPLQQEYHTSTVHDCCWQPFCQELIMYEYLCSTGIGEPALHISVLLYYVTFTLPL